MSFNLKNAPLGRDTVSVIYLKKAFFSIYRVNIYYRNKFHGILKKYKKICIKKPATQELIFIENNKKII